MSIVPDASADRAQRPIDTHAVDVAEQALRHFGNLTRGQAAALLETWTWRPTLGQREQAALLARFPRGGIRVCGDAR
jgi:hypothetical protein